MSTELPLDGLTRMVKVEVVISGDLLAALGDVFEAAGATGYTSVANVSGVGHDGAFQGRLAFNQRDALTLVITVLPPEGAEPVVTAVRRLLDDHYGVMFVSETFVSRADYFRQQSA